MTPVARRRKGRETYLLECDAEIDVHDLARAAVQEDIRRMSVTEP
jgi:hypothetical protein